MKKMTDEELGTLLTREMMSMMKDTSLTYEQRARIFCAIAFDEPLDDTMSNAFANSLRTGFARINNNRIKSVNAARNRKKEYAKHRRTLIGIDDDRHLSASIDGNSRAFPGKAKQSKAKQSIISPYNPPYGGEGDDDSSPSAITPEEILDAPQPSPDPIVDCIVAEIESTYPYKVHRRKLTRCVSSCLKKNTADEIIGGYRRHNDAWKDDEYRYAPGKITDWLYDGKYLEPVRKKTAAAKPEVASGCGKCGVEIV